jgi:sensor histidine kinase YesM
MKPSLVFIIHTSLWLSYLSLLFIIIAAATQGFIVGPDVFYILKLAIPITVFPFFSVFYLFYFYIFPNYIKKKKIMLSLAYGFLISIVSATICGWMLIQLLGREIIFEKGISFVISVYVLMLLIGIFAGVISIIIKGFITWYDEIKLKEELNLKNYQIELALVKSQLDPHFLFNMINNIDVLILKDAQLASEYLNKLSDILRFMLYETKSEKIALSKEIEYIEKYIALQKTRSSNDNFVHFTVNGKPSNHVIPPMLLIPFIENAFKHVSNKKKDSAIAISLVIDDEKILFECANEYSENNKSVLVYNGLGNDLIRKRIELMYHQKHTLTISNQNNYYKVNLELKND